MDLERQRRLLRRMAASRGGAWLPPGLCLLAAALALIGLWQRQPLWFVGALFAAAVAAAVREIEPHVARAAQALQRGELAPGTVRVEVQEGSESRSHVATVRDAAGCGWRFEFRPIGWQPVAGEQPARLYAHPGVGWPALVETDQGLLWPCRRPGRLEG